MGGVNLRTWVGGAKEEFREQKNFPNRGMFGQILTNEQRKVGGEVRSREKEHGC